MSDRGAGVLAERLLDLFGDRGDLVKATRDHARVAKRILGEHGLFIADVSNHEPIIWWAGPSPVGGCSCGWIRSLAGDSFFDHLAP